MRYSIQDGNFVHVDTYDDSKSCYCHSCGRRVTQLWENNVKSFVHVDRKPCKWYSTESNIHIAFKESFIGLKGKEVLLSRGTLLTAVCGSVNGSGDILLNPMKVKILGVYFEMDFRKVIPDVVLKTDKGYIYIEIVFSHGISEEKQGRIDGLCMQISVSARELREWVRYGSSSGEVDILRYLECYPSCIRWYNDEYIELVRGKVKEDTRVHKACMNCYLNPTKCKYGKERVFLGECRDCEYNILSVYLDSRYERTSVVYDKVYCGYCSDLNREVLVGLLKEKE